MLLVLKVGFSMTRKPFSKTFHCHSFSSHAGPCTGPGLALEGREVHAADQTRWLVLEGSGGLIRKGASY